MRRAGELSRARPRALAVDQSNIEGFIATGIQTFLLKCKIMLAFISPSYFRRIWVRSLFVG